MTEDAFDRLLYTDCRAGTGRGAGGGFQVQAQSAGVDSAQATMAVGWLLYEAQNAWIVQRRPVEEFPLGFAHACDAGYGTAQSRYVGTESTGGRQGNHLSDCLLTREAGRYGPTRPVQLWRSDQWRAEAWESTDCPPLDEQLAPGPLTVEAVAAWLRDRPERPAVLSRLLSVLEKPGGRRVTIVSAGAQEALTWIAAATLLLPMRLALATSFKVFSANLGRAPQRIIAVPRELNPQLAPGRGESWFLLDADQDTADAGEVSTRARFLVGQLASAADPYDIVDAVELADSLSGESSGEELDALLTAWALTRPGDPLSDRDALFGWISRASAEPLAEHGGTVARMILAATPTAQQLRWIDQAIARRRIELDPAAVRAQLLVAELTETRTGSAPPAEVLTEVRLSAEARRDADSQVSSAIVLSPGSRVDLMLRLAHRHGISLDRSAPLRQALQQFVCDWIDHDADYDPRAWADGEVVLDAVCDELRGRLARQGAASIFPAVKRLNRHLSDRAGDAGDPLARQLNVAGIAALPPEDRPARIKALISEICASGVPAAALDDLQRALVQWDAAGTGEVIALIDCLPDSAEIRPEIAKVAVGRLEQAADQPTERMLRILAALDRRKLVPETGPLETVLAADRGVDEFIDCARSGRIVTDPRYFRKTVGLLQQAGQVNSSVVKTRLGDVLQACQDCVHPELGGAVIGILESPLPRMLIGRWAGELGRHEPDRAALWGIDTAAYPELPERRLKQIATAMSGFATKLSEAEYQKWTQVMMQHIRPGQDELFEWLIGYQAPRSRTRRNRWIFRDGG